MKVLTVCRAIPEKRKLHNYEFAEFIKEQNDAVSELGVDFDYFLIKKAGLLGYISHYSSFRKMIKKGDFDLIHAHGGHIGSFCNLQKITPVITTYHGSDINTKEGRITSMISFFLSKHRIFVSLNLARIAKVKTNFDIIPAGGINFNIFKQFNKKIAREKLGFPLARKIILFGGKKNNTVKNFQLAERAIKKTDIDFLVLELSGYSRQEVFLVLNASDCVLLTSFSEGSPTIIKEALACNRPIVSVDVGDVKEITKGIDGVFISGFDSDTLAYNIKSAIKIDSIRSREKIKFLDKSLLAKKVLKVYKKTLNQ